MFYFMEVEEALEFADVTMNATDGRKMTKYTHPDKELELKANILFQPVLLFQNILLHKINIAGVKAPPFSNTL